MDENGNDPLTIMDPLLNLARKRFGIEYLYPYQRLVVSNVIDAMNPRDADTIDEESGPHRQIVILPTGAGKSLCFQLPAPLGKGPTVVVYPLLGLIADQERRLAKASIQAVVLKGGMSAEERETAFGAIRKKTSPIILTNPETLMVPAIRTMLASAGVSHLVIDEAHCVSEWGDSFRPAYLSLGEVITALDPGAVTAFTATASPPVLARVAQVLFGSERYSVIAGTPDRPNIDYSVIRTLSPHHTLRDALDTMSRPLIVFVASRPGAELLAEYIDEVVGLPARFYHAGLEKEERSAIEQWFLASDDGVLCATCAYGMGMDKANVRSVIHFGSPSSVEAYLQESGRAGRDGSQSRALLIQPLKGTLQTIQKSTGTGTASEESALAMQEARKHAMDGYARGGYTCRRRYLMSALGWEGADSLACGACDLCRGEAPEMRGGSAVEGLAELTALAETHPRRFSARKVADLLTGATDAPVVAMRGALSSWSADEVRESLDAAVAAGVLRVCGKGPWKGTIVPPGRYGSGKHPAACRNASKTRKLWPFDSVVHRITVKDRE